MCAKIYIKYKIFSTHFLYVNECEYQTNDYDLNVLYCIQHFCTGTIHEDHRKKWLSGFALGPLHYSEWR